MVEVFVAENSVPLSTQQLGFLSEYLPREMIERAGKFRRWQDSQAYLLSKFLLAEGIKDCGFTEHALEKMQYTEYGRPYLSPDFDFNISHSGKHIVCAISKLYKVGIDVEEIHPIDLADFANQFTEHELSRIKNATNQNAEFFRYWTIKEAVIKADGRGLSLPLTNVFIDIHAHVEGAQWHFYKIDIDPGYMAHLAVNTLLPKPVVLKRIPMPV